MGTERSDGTVFSVVAWAASESGCVRLSIQALYGFPRRCPPHTTICVHILSPLVSAHAAHTYTYRSSSSLTDNPLGFEQSSYTLSFSSYAYACVSTQVIKLSCWPPFPLSDSWSSSSLSLFVYQIQMNTDFLNFISKAFRPVPCLPFIHNPPSLCVHFQSTSSHHACSYSLSCFVIVPFILTGYPSSVHLIFELKPMNMQRMGVLASYTIKYINLKVISGTISATTIIG